MKNKLQHWLLLVALCLFGFVSRLPAEIRESEAAFSRQLIEAVNAGNYLIALEILHHYGVTNTTLEPMATRLGQPVQRIALGDPFLQGYIQMEDSGGGHKLLQRIRSARFLNYPTPLWVVDDLNLDKWRDRAYLEWKRNKRAAKQLRQDIVLPIGVMNIRSDDQLIRYFLWYNQYASRLHSVGLNWYYLNNFDAPDHAAAYRLLNALFQLVKARNPDAFVWLLVEPTVDNSDLRWLETMRFGYDGLLVGNLRNFTSRFESTRKRYLPYVGETTPMVLAGFYGYEKPLVKAAGMGEGRDAAMRAVGDVILPQMDRHAQRVWELGYRGVVVDWRVVEAVTAALANN